MVYVDDMDASYRRMKMSHLIADSKEELLDMVDKIGVQRKWIQNEDTPNEHFDICLSKKALAISLGVKLIGWRELGEIVMNKKLYSEIYETN